jgi:hypothetical protein
MNQAPVKTQAEIDALKHEWQRDPCWDIEETEGFEAYREELAAWRRGIAFKQSRAESRRLRDKADNLGCSVALVRYIERLERAVETVEEFHRTTYYGEPIPFPFYSGRRS